MKSATSFAFALAYLVFLIPPSGAHYNMLLPQTASVKLGKAVVIVYQWGHPFEHQLFDAPAPLSVTALAPDGRKTNLGTELEKRQVSGTSAKSVTAYRFRFTPRQRGDYVLLLETPPIFMKEEKVFFQDTVKVVLHVEDQEGWDAAAGRSFELVPLTRPYGLEPGMAFQAQVLAGGKPMPGALVEIERYNVKPPRKLPPDEHMTRTAKTDPAGVVTCTLTDAGWWCLTARRDAGKRRHQGKSYPVRRRTTFWVFVDDKVAVK
jgi:cobalt/nickel transport protein